MFRDTMTTRFGGPNSFAAFGGLLTAFGLAAYYEAKSRNVLHARRWLTVPAVGTLGVIGASGRQGVAIWLAAVAIVLFIYRRQIFLVLVAPAAVAFAVLYFDSIFDVLSRGQYENSLNTLTGRTTFWAAGVDAFEQRPVTGYGFGAGSRFVALKAIDKDQFTHLHNGFLEALTGVGIVGFLPFVYATGRAVTWSAVRLLRGVGVTFAILMVPLFLQNMVGLGFGAWLNENVILFALVVALADAEGIIPRRVRSPARLPMYR